MKRTLLLNLMLARILFVFLIILLTSFQYIGAQVTVTGVVSSSDNNAPMPGVNVLQKGTTNGVITDANGKFKITVSANDAILVFSFVGMATIEMPVAGKTTIDIVLNPETSELSEIVVVGYGMTKKASLTGAVDAVKGEDLKQSPATNYSNTLVGRIPGLVAVTKSGEPGQDKSTLFIRGNNTLGDNSPLIVLDGIPNRDLNQLDPADIESFTILKDASAAIYGTQAANGVIMITTKRGKLGKPTITVNLNGGYNQPTRIPKMADAATYATMLNEIAFYKDATKGMNQTYSAADIQKFKDGSDPWGHPNTDWFKAVFKPWTEQDYENVSVSGGTENMKYFLSMGRKYEDAYYKNSATNYGQYNFRSNIDGKISQNIDIAFDVSGRQIDENYPTVAVGDVFRMLMRGKPNMPAFWPNGLPGPDIEYGFNPAVVSTDATGYNDTKYYTVESNLRLNVKIPWVKGLSLQANGSFDKIIDNQKEFQTPWYLYTWDGTTLGPDNLPLLTKGQRGLSAPQLTEKNDDGYKLTGNLYATYERTIGSDHNFKLMAGTESQKGLTNWFSAFRKNYVTNLIDQMFAGANDTYMSNDGSASQNAHMSYFGRLNYDYKQKYLVEFLVRYDGSYMFGPTKNYGTFPGVSVGWRLSDEGFWKDNIKFFDDFKIRASWGQTGNDRIYYNGSIQEYKYLALYGFVSGKSYVFGQSNNAPLLAEQAVPNPNVTWEVANQSNIGINASFLNSKMTVEADYFYNLRSQILIQRNASVPSTAGFTLPPENIGKVSNRGFEYVVGYHDAAGDFRYSVSVNGSFAKNKIVFWDETPGIPSYQQSTGKPMPADPSNPDAALRYVAIGVFKDDAAVAAYPHWSGARPGDIIFKDVNNDGKIDALDRVRSDKNGIPRYIGGLNVSLSYKQFDFSMLVQGAAGAEVYINPESGSIGNFYQYYAENRWTPTNPSTTFPRAWDRDNEYWRSQGNTFWLKSTDYMRLKNIEIGYNISPIFCKNIGIQGLRIYASSANLFTLDKTKLIDPELDAGTSYPLQRVVNLGLTLTF
jgi:TonB-dependent starch-binding outer membrane protein SusC